MNGHFSFWIHRDVHDAEHALELHAHDFIELIYVVRGDGTHVLEEGVYRLRAGDVFIINPGEMHTYRINALIID